MSFIMSFTELFNRPMPVTLTVKEDFNDLYSLDNLKTTMFKQ